MQGVRVPQDESGKKGARATSGKIESIQESIEVSMAKQDSVLIRVPPGGASDWGNVG
jgi:hypothetical protein